MSLKDTEMSAMYLPDSTDTSISIQIPPPNSTEDLLLRSTSHQDFLMGMEDSFDFNGRASPPRNTLGPLELGQLTPLRRSPRKHRTTGPSRRASPQKMPDIIECTDDEIPVVLPVTEHREEPVVGATSLPTAEDVRKILFPGESQTTSDEAPASLGDLGALNKRREPSKKKTVLSGGVTKAKPRTRKSARQVPTSSGSRSSEAERGVASENKPQEDLEQPTSGTAYVPQTGAEQPISLPSHGMSECVSPTADSYISGDDILSAQISDQPPSHCPEPSIAAVQCQDDHDGQLETPPVPEPLTLSQLSPAKPLDDQEIVLPIPGSPSTSAAGFCQSSSHTSEPSPASSSLKRTPPSVEVEDDAPRRKKPRIVPLAVARPRPTGIRSRSDSHRQQKTKTSAGPSRISSRGKEKARSNPSNKLAGSSGTTHHPPEESHHSLPVQASQTGRRVVSWTAPAQSSGASGDDKTSDHLQASNDHPMTTNSLASSHKPSTKPFPFSFSVDSRMKAREEAGKKATASSSQRSTSSSSSSKHHHPIPDFKRLHAVQEAESQKRRELITPLVPIPIEFSTDARLAQRRAFDEKVKEKEKEALAALELERIQREKEEEEEVKEIRKHAAPVVHQVPDWYKDAPKKKEQSR